MIFHTDGIIVRVDNSKENVICEIYVHKWLVKDAKFIVDRLQCVWVPLFSGLKLGTSVYFVRRNYERKKKCWPLHKHTVVLLVG